MKSEKLEEHHIICTVRSKLAHREKVRALLLELVEPARQESGCLYYDLYAQIAQPDTFYIIDGWASEDAVKAHAAHPNVPRVVEQLLPLLAGPLEVVTSHRVSDPRYTAFASPPLAGGRTSRKCLLPLE